MDCSCVFHFTLKVFPCCNYTNLSTIAMRVVLHQSLMWLLHPKHTMCYGSCVYLCCCGCRHHFRFLTCDWFRLVTEFLACLIQLLQGWQLVMCVGVVKITPFQLEQLVMPLPSLFPQRFVECYSFHLCKLSYFGQACF